MIKNISFTLKGGHIRRSWYDTDVVDDIKVKRLLRMIEKMDNLDEIKELINKIMPAHHYDPRAEFCVMYNQGNNIVRLTKCVFKKDKNLFTRGEYVEEFNLNC